jgi:hypothetical protein
MSRATKLISRLDRALSRHQSFGDNPDAFVDELFADVEELLQGLEQKSKPEHWAEIYVERDRARIKQSVLNRVMARSSE